MITFLDTFTGPDGSIVGHIPEVGGAWNAFGNTWNLDTNRLVNDDVSGFRDIANDAPQYSFLSTWNFAMGDDPALFYVIFRRVDGNNLFAGKFTYDNDAETLLCELLEIVAGVQTILSSFVIGVAAAANVKMQVLAVNKSVAWRVNSGYGTATLSSLLNSSDFQVTVNVDPPNVSPFFNSAEFADSPITEDAMINLRTGQWNLHREGVAKLLAIAGQSLCAGTAMAVTAEIRLWTSANDPGCADVAADYTEATFSGYAPVLIDSGDDGCTDILEIGVNVDGVGQLVFDQQAWTEGSPATITETINGAYMVLLIGGDEFLLATFPFAIPVPMAAAGDILKVAGFALLDCQMAPVA